MIAIKFEVCSGCGDCIQVCPTGALLLQNGKACWQAGLCEDCGLCVDACPQNAILLQEPQPMGADIIRIPGQKSAGLSTDSPARPLSIRDTFWPAVGSFLLWTGREILPRLADLALNYVDYRIQASEPGLIYEKKQSVNQIIGKRNRRRRTRRRQFRNK